MLIYDRIRGRLQVLEVTFQAWATDPPPAVDRLAAVSELTGLQGQVHSLVRGDR